MQHKLLNYSVALSSWFFIKFIEICKRSMILLKLFFMLMLSNRLHWKMNAFKWFNEKTYCDESLKMEEKLGISKGQFLGWFYILPLVGLMRSVGVANGFNSQNVLKLAIDKDFSKSLKYIEKFKSFQFYMNWYIFETKFELYNIIFFLNHQKPIYYYKLY